MRPLSAPAVHRVRKHRTRHVDATFLPFLPNERSRAPARLRALARAPLCACAPRRAHAGAPARRPAQDSALRGIRARALASTHNSEDASLLTARRHELSPDCRRHRGAETGLAPRNPTDHLKSNKSHPSLRISERPRCYHVSIAPMSFGTFGGATPPNTLDNARAVTRLDFLVRKQLLGPMNPAKVHKWNEFPGG